VVLAADLMVGSRSPAVALMTRALERAEVHTGAMIALVPTAEDAKRLAVDDGEPAEELHVTLRYLGKGADFSEQSRKQLIEMVRGQAEKLKPFTAEAFNVAIFNPSGDEPCVVLGLGGEDIVKAHAAVEAAVEDHGADLPEPHKPFVPHLTLVYTADAGRVEELTDRVGPITFDRLRVAFAGEVTDIPLAGRALERTYVRDDEGQFADIPGVGDDAVKLADKLKLGSRIQLGEGERLLSSRKFKTDRDDGSMDMLAAEVETPSGREVRIGIIDADDSKRWPGGPDSKRDARVAEIRAERAELDEDDPRFEQLGEELDGIESEADQGGLNRTGALTPAALGELHATLDAAATKAREWSKAWNKFWDDHDDEANEQSQLATLDHRGSLTAEQTARFAELNVILDRSPEWQPTFAEGFVPVHGGGQLAYKVQGFDGEGGRWRIDLGIRPDGEDDSWYPGANDDAARFDPKDVKALLAGLAELAGDGAKVTIEAIAVLSPSPAVRLMLYARSLEATDRFLRRGRMVSVERGAKGRFGDTLDGPDLDAIIANPKTGDRERVKAHFMAMKTPELRAEAKKRGVYIGDVSRKEQMADRIVQHEIGHKLDSQSIRQGTWDDSSAWTRPAEMQLAARSEPDLDKMTNPQLKELAKAEGIKGYSKMRKAELVQAIQYTRASDPGGNVPAVDTPKRGSVNQRRQREDDERAKELAAGLENIRNLDQGDPDSPLQRQLRERQAARASLRDADTPTPAVGKAGAPTSKRDGGMSAVTKAIRSGDPDALEGFSRTELRTEAARRGIDTEGMFTPDIADVLTANELSGGKPKAAPALRDQKTSNTPIDAAEVSRHAAAASRARDHETAVRARREGLESELTAKNGGNPDQRNWPSADRQRMDAARAEHRRARREADDADALLEQTQDEFGRNAGARPKQRAVKGADIPAARVELDRMRANPQLGDRAKVAEILKPMSHKDLDALADQYGWSNSVGSKDTKDRKRKNLEELLVGAKLTDNIIMERRGSSDALFAPKDRPSVQSATPPDRDSQLAGFRQQLASLEAARDSERDLRRSMEFSGQANDLKRRIERIESGADDGKIAQPRAKTRADIADTYRRLAGKPGDLVSLAVLRGNLQHISHDELTAVLKEMDRERLIQLDPDSNAKAIPKEGRNAAIRLGGEDKHFIRFMRAS
jgi:2'-5' RNA ligase